MQADNDDKRHSWLGDIVYLLLDLELKKTIDWSARVSKHNPSTWPVVRFGG